MNLTGGLNKRFDIVTASKTEQDFYLNAYQYYDYIFSNPELSNLYSEGERSYRRKATEIWKDYDKSDREKSSYQTQLSSKMEKNDMYCNGVGLEVRLYRPLKDYYETKEPDMLQDPHAVALVKGIDYASKVCAKRYPDNNVKGIKKSFNSWFKDQRDEYQQELTTFHVQFMDKVEKLDKVGVPEKKSLKPFLDLNTGDFLYFGLEGNLPTSGQEFKVLKTLLRSPDYKASYDSLVNSYSPVTKANKVHKQGLYTIIRNIKRSLGVLPKSDISKPDPFKVVRSEGYRLEIQR